MVKALTNNQHNHEDTYSASGITAGSHEDYLKG